MELAGCTAYDAAIQEDGDRLSGSDSRNRLRADDGEEAVVDGVTEEDTCERLRNYNTHACNAQARRSLLAGGAAAPVAARNNHVARLHVCRPNVGSRSSSTCRAISASSLTV